MPLNNNDNESRQKEPRSSFLKSLPKKQKNAFIFMVFLSISILFLWFWQINYRLVSVFDYGDKKPKDFASHIDEFQQLASLHADGNLDTDGDGLTDAEEMNIYHTSPYLVDTDGDGISDYDEVRTGTDPLCPEGQDCSNEIEIVKKPQDSVVLVPEISEPSSDTPDELEEVMMTLLSGEANVQNIRALLITSGIDTNLINNLSDEELLVIYREGLNESQLPKELSIDPSEE